MSSSHLFVFGVLLGMLLVNLWTIWHASRERRMLEAVREDVLRQLETHTRMLEVHESDPIERRRSKAQWN